MDPFFDIDIPRLENSARAAAARSKYRKGKHFNADEVGWFLAFIGNGNLSSGEKADLRKAANILTRLLDPCSCGLNHCEHYNNRQPMSCGEGKNPRICPKAKKYLDKKMAEHPECLFCQHRENYDRSGKRSFFQGHLCRVQRNADRPDNCPKIKKEDEDDE